MVPADQHIVEVVFISFHHGQEFKITQVNKNKEDNYAYLTTASPEQCKKVIMYQVILNHEILTPIIASEGVVSKKEFQKRNCSTLIIKECNLYYSASEITTVLKQLIGDMNVVKTYFKDGDVEKNLYVGVCNLDVLNPTKYKQFVKNYCENLQQECDLPSSSKESRWI